jgi:hypothetical protein
MLRREAIQIATRERIQQNQNQENAMLNRLMLLVSLFASPDGFTVSNELTLSGPYKVHEQDSELSQHPQKQVKDKDDLTTAGGNWWNDSGPGPAVKDGRTWYCSPPMYGYTPSGSVMQTLSYTWNDDNLNGWDSLTQVELRIYGGGYVWRANVTAQPSGTLNASGQNIPASSDVRICMGVDTFQVSLYNPPYINYISSNVYYTY